MRARILAVAVILACSAAPSAWAAVQDLPLAFPDQFERVPAPPEPPLPPPAPVAAQVPKAPAAPKTPAPPKAPAPPEPPAAPEPPMLMPPSPGSNTNVRVELTITDETGAEKPLTKTVSMISTDGSWARIRAGASARPNERTGTVPVELNVDARPRILANNKVRVELTMEYRPLSTVTAGDPSQVSPTNLNQSITVTLTDGAPLVVSRAADPVTDRRIVVEVKATVLK